MWHSSDRSCSCCIRRTCCGSSRNINSAHICMLTTCRYTAPAIHQRHHSYRSGYLRVSTRWHCGCGVTGSSWMPVRPRSYGVRPADVSIRSHGRRSEYALTVFSLHLGLWSWDLPGRWRLHEDACFQDRVQLFRCPPPDMEHSPITDAAGSAVARDIIRHALAWLRQCDACRTVGQST